jgi:hypothetical protein
MTETPVHQLIADVEAGLREMAKRPVPASPGKKLLETIDPSLRDEVRAAVEGLRAEQVTRKAVSGSAADQAAGLAKTMVADFERLLELGGGEG